ncbi:hypothetical protein CYLTODRAFT_407538 [Cylindrobasidium torrendii FP15055 ss-10]|uniref:Uncharacterized protein n=1 Tax=Cylindrobasidium torrendii FP15055 ss-10 TaxID=1314674 RepID=A0A0D7BQ49_9AGAR|nr:hypothetical protein CYLTODRAFT_407538 [Cylindrobasidium torrendii FP15055 ss-10]
MDRGRSVQSPSHPPTLDGRQGTVQISQRDPFCLSTPRRRILLLSSRLFIRTEHGHAVAGLRARILQGFGSNLVISGRLQAVVSVHQSVGVAVLVALQEDHTGKRVLAECLDEWCQGVANKGTMFHLWFTMRRGRSSTPIDNESPIWRRLLAKTQDCGAASAALDDDLPWGWPVIRPWYCARSTLVTMSSRICVACQQYV